MERSKEISGESFLVMILRVASSVTCVLNGGNSSRLCQPSSKAMRAIGSKRPEALEIAPRPRRCSRSTSVPPRPPDESPPAGAEGAVTGGRGFRAREERAMSLCSPLLRTNQEQRETPQPWVRKVPSAHHL